MLLLSLSCNKFIYPNHGSDRNWAALYEVVASFEKYMANRVRYVVPSINRMHVTILAFGLFNHPERLDIFLTLRNGTARFIPSLAKINRTATQRF